MPIGCVIFIIVKGALSIRKSLKLDHKCEFNKCYLGDEDPRKVVTTQKKMENLLCPRKEGRARYMSKSPNM